MSTQATTPHSTIRTTPIVREYRIERTAGSRLQGLLARLRGTGPVEAQWRWQPVAPHRSLAAEMHDQAAMLLSAR